MEKSYRVGIIGCTNRGDYGHGIDVALAKMPEVNIVAVADEDDDGRASAQQRTSAARSYASYREMLRKEALEIVAICPRWIDQHHEMLIAAADAGCHVYMEKPFCRDLVEADEVVNAFDMRHLQLGIAHVAQYSPVLDTVLKLVADGVIGDLLELRGRGKEDHRGGGEDLWVLGSHVFALMRQFGGGQPSACTAVVRQSGQPIRREDIVQGNEGIGLLAGDQIQATYEFADGMTGFFSSQASKGGNPSRFGLQVYGSQGVIEVFSGYLSEAYVLRDSSWSPGRTGKKWETITSAGIGAPESRNDGTYQGGHIAAVRNLIESIEKQTTTRCSYNDCRDIVEMTAAVYESHRLGERVTLPLETRQNPLALL